MSRSKLRTQLESEVGECLASDLVAHLDREAVIVVSSGLRLIDAALAVAEDDAASVGRWIETKEFVRPSPRQVDDWKSHPDAKFRSVIVRPYVLVQPRAE